MKNVIEYSPGDHYFTEPQYLPADTIIRGQGMGVTVLHNQTPDVHHHALFSSQTPDGRLTYEGFSVDNHLHRLALVATGPGNTADEVVVYNHSSTWLNDEELESFAILFDNPKGASVATDNLIHRCHVRDFKSGYNGGLVIAGLGGQLNGTIRQCTYNGSGQPGQGHNMEGVMGANLVEQCSFYNIALGAYTEGGLDMTIRDCRFYGVHGTAARINLERPQGYFAFLRNYVELVQGVGVQVYSMPNHLGRLEIIDNTFIGTGRWLDLKDTYVILSDNTWEVGLKQTVTNCVGTIRNNLTTNGDFNAYRLAHEHRPGKSQLKVKTNAVDPLD